MSSTPLSSSTKVDAPVVPQRSSPSRTTARGLSPASRHWTATVEPLTIGLLLPVIGLVIDRRDPFFVRHPFSWCVLPPLLAGLRYGFVAGTGSAVALGTAMLVGWRLNLIGAAALPGETVIGMFIVAMLAGHFSDVWLRDTARARATCEHAKRRADEIAKAHFLLRLSHDRLQEQSPGVSNLQDALDHASDATNGSTTNDWSALGQQYVTLASRFASVEVASLVTTDSAGALGPLVATLGPPRSIPARDPMLVAALATRQITCVATMTVDAKTRAPGLTSGLIAVIPVVDSAGLLHGAFCIETMSFFSFTRRNLEALAVLAGHFADRVATDAHRGIPFRIRARAFLTGMDAALEQLRAGGPPAALGILAVVAGSPLSGITDLILAGVLGPGDSIHRTRGRGKDTLLWLLMPGATEAHVTATMSRIESLTRQRLDLSLSQAGGTAAFRFLAPSDERRAVMAELQRSLEARRGHR